MTKMKQSAAAPGSPSTEAWVVVTDDPNGGYLIQGRRYRGSRMLSCFLSPFDALIAAHFSRGPTQTCRILPTTDLDPSLFRTGWLGGTHGLRSPGVARVPGGHTIVPGQQTHFSGYVDSPMDPAGLQQD